MKGGMMSSATPAMGGGCKTEQTVWLRCIRQHMLKTLLRMVVIAFLSFHFALFGFDGCIMQQFARYINMYIGK